jgi:ubiquinone/menaquinone biosynthesis C-methylase UbiE
VEPGEFNRASHAVWEAMAPGWERQHSWFETHARPVTERMLEAFQVEPGGTILELAAGTGIVGLTAAQALGGKTRLILSDFSPAMVEAAQRRGSELGLDNVDYRVLDAEALELPDESVDGVICRWGYMLMGDPAKALGETHRVLRPGGRLSAAVFASPQQNPWAALPMQVLVEAGHVSPPAPGQPGILSLADSDRVRGLLADAGLEDVEIDPVAFAYPFDTDEDYWRFLTEMAGAISMVLSRLDEDDLAGVREELSRRLEPFRVADGIELGAVSLVVSASRG